MRRLARSCAVSAALSAPLHERSKGERTSHHHHHPPPSLSIPLIVMPLGSCPYLPLSIPYRISSDILSAHKKLTENTPESPSPPHRPVRALPHFQGRTLSHHHHHSQQVRSDPCAQHVLIKLDAEHPSHSAMHARAQRVRAWRSKKITKCRIYCE